MGLTDEQEAAVELFQQQKSLKISAFAGTGKTTTLAAIGKSSRRSGVYLAFNKSIAVEASGRFPTTVDCRTTHSLALRSLPSEYRGNQSKVFDGLQGNRVAQLLDLRELAIGKVLLKPRSLGYITAKTIQRFCQSANSEITPNHVPLTGKLQQLMPDHQAEFARYLAKLATHMWDRMLDPNDAAPLGHDGYLKLWSLNCPEMRYDFILLDEAQDTNEAVLSVLTQQASQLILVGDRHQQIYEWRGAVNAMTKVKTAAESSLTQSFRFGTEIAEVANKVLTDLNETRPLRGNPAVSSTISTTGTTRAVLCRTNVGVIEITLAELQRNRRPHVVGGVVELIRMLEDVTRLKRLTPAETPDLFGFSSWDEVVEFSESEEGGSLRTFVKIVNQSGERLLIQALRSVSDNEEAADLVVSTGHKSKGREWPSVTLHTDFEPRKKAKSDPDRLVANEEDVRLLYVASTRPRQHLVISPRLASVWGLACATPLGAQEKEAATPAPSRLMDLARERVARPELPTIAKVVSPPALDEAKKTGERRKSRDSAPPEVRKVHRVDSSSQVIPEPLPARRPGLLASLFNALFGR